MQAIHSLEAEESWYVPASHTVQALAISREYVPASHTVQVVSLVAPVAAEYVPAAHAVQVAALVAPVTAEYVPASQAVQLLAPACSRKTTSSIAISLYLPHPVVAENRIFVAALEIETLAEYHASP